MNTPAHLIFAAAAFARPDAPRRTWAALGGALAPDLSLYILSLSSIYVLGIDARYVFGTLYFSDAWQAVFRVDKSVFVWGAALLLAWWTRSGAGMVFAASALLHIAFDLPLHHDDGRPHFWPLTNWVYESPVSYWDSQAHGRIVGAAEMAACVVLIGVLLRRFTDWRARGVIVAGGLVQLAPVFVWAFVFAGGG